MTWDYMPYAMVIKPGYLYQPAYGHGGRILPREVEEPVVSDNVITTDQGLYPVKLSRPLPPGYNLLNLGLLAAGVNDSWGTWREKESPPFRLSKAGVETHFLYRGDAG